MAAGPSPRASPGVREPGTPAGQSRPPEPSDVAAARTGWTAGRVIALVAGSVLAVVSLLLLGGAGALTWADQQPQGGYLTTGTDTYYTGNYALASNPVRWHGGWGWLGRFAGEVRIRVTSVSPAKPVFVAIGPAAEVSRYLAGVSYASVTALGDRDVMQHPGTAVPAPPAFAVGWAAQAHGKGTQTLRWAVRSGEWTAVVMNPDGSPGISIRADVGVSSPVLPALAGELLAAGTMTGLAAAALIVVPARLAARGR